MLYIMKQSLNQIDRKYQQLSDFWRKKKPQRNEEFDDSQERYRV